jgi:hypothetical protein
MSVDVNYAETTYGLRELQVAEIDSSTGATGSWVDWSGVSLEFTVETEAAQQEANDKVIAQVRLNKWANFSIEAGHMPPDVAEIVFGITLSTSGSGATEEKEMLVNADDDTPAFAIRGRIIGGKSLDGGGGGDAVLESVGACYANSGFSPTFSGGSWWSPSVEGVILPDSSGDIFKMTQRATAAVLS